MSNHRVAVVGPESICLHPPRTGLCLASSLFNIWICSLLGGCQEKSWIFDVEFLVAVLPVPTCATIYDDDRDGHVDLPAIV